MEKNVWFFKKNNQPRKHFVFGVFSILNNEIELYKNVVENMENCYIIKISFKCKIYKDILERQDNMKKKQNNVKRLIFLLALLLMAAGCGSQETENANVEDSTEALETTTEEWVVEELETIEGKPLEVREELPQVSQEDVPQYEGYTLLWNDEFNGDTLNSEIWRYELHAPGWVNAELQEYTDSTDNIFVKDGRLIIKALKTQDNAGKDYYTSGKITTRGNQDFMYGKVIARAKVPEGKGLWPAFWMMPSKDGIYGSWPKGGEIDIMEILGNEPNKSYSTIHYGEPHAQQQGEYVLDNGTFADSFHEFCVEWEPGEMRFYVDENLLHTVNDWFTETPYVSAPEYPAPFNQNFYVQLNLAVGGTWPGNPDETTDFENAEFEVDYVRVYQKPEYDMNVTKPEKVFRELTEDGNLLYNANFAEVEDLADDKTWDFLLNESGMGTAEIKEGAILIAPQDEGSVDYSLQLVQAQLPLYEGKKYHLEFEAKASEERMMNIAVSGPNAGWIRYFPDTEVELKTDWQTYSYDFEMLEKDDNNGRIEFNMGNAGSLATISIRNLRMEIVE